VDAALTYARRYALFTLVGIAGEDDLDAPDLGQTPNGGPTESNVRSEPRDHDAAGLTNDARGRKRPAIPKLPLHPDASAALREQLLSKLGAIATPMRPRYGRGGAFRPSTH